jgi:hypothetical protein
MINPGFKPSNFLRQILCALCWAACGLMPLTAAANSGSAGQRMAEASIEDSNTNGEQAEQPGDFKNRLSKRRISEYASFDRALFDRSFDVGYAMSYSQFDIAGFQSTRALQQGVFVSTGLGDKTGISLSLDRGRVNFYDTTEGTPVSLGKLRNSSNTLTFNHLLLPETLRLPQLVGSLNLGTGREDGLGNKTRGLGLSTSRTLESASLFGFFQFGQSRIDGGNWQSGRSVGVSYFLTVNHRLAAGLGYSLSKSAASLSVPSTSATLVYRLLPDWVLRSTASQVLGANESSSVAFDLTYTFEP